MMKSSKLKLIPISGMDGWMRKRCKDKVFMEFWS